MADPPGREFRGSPLVAMYNAPSPWKTPEFPIVYPSDDHVILYEISQRGFDNGPPDARAGRDLWDSEHVRMPHSSQSFLETSSKMGFSSTTRRWETIEKALRKKIRNSQDLAKAILTYNTKFEYIWKFEAMHKFFDEFTAAEYFFKHTLPAMVGLALDLPKLVQMPIPLLKMGMNKSISLSQLQIASLLANAFFCTYPRRNSTYPAAEFGSYPRINFTSLYERIDLDNVQQKLMCIIHYFTRVCSDMPKGVVTFSRRSVHPKGCPHWDKSNTLIADIPLHADHKATIEDALGMIQVDFANKFLGGGILGRGCVQEEIRFLVCPEMMVSMLFSEKMDANEAVLVIGCERYCNYTGYGSRNFKFSGDHRDPTPVDGSGRKRCAILAIDAVLYRNPAEQFRKNMILRELNKAWVGFSFHTDPRSPVLEYPGVATGNWGCGAFGGSPQLKALVQLMAAAQARRPLGYFTFGDVHLRNEVAEAHNMMKIHNVTVGQLFKQLKKYCKSDRNIHLYKYIEDALVRKSHKPQHGGTRRHNQVNDSSPESSESEDEPIEEELINFSQEESPGLYSGNQQPQYSEQSKKKQKPHGSNSGNQKTSNSHTSGHSSHKKPSYNDPSPKLDLCIPEHKQNTAAGNSKPSVSHSIAYNQSNAPAPPPGFTTTPHGTSHATPTGNWLANYVSPLLFGSSQRETGAIGSHLPPLASDLPYGNMAGSSHNLTASHHKPTVPPRNRSKPSTSNISNNHAATFYTKDVEVAASLITRTVSAAQTKESYQSSSAAPMDIGVVETTFECIFPKIVYREYPRRRGPSHHRRGRSHRRGGHRRARPAYNPY